MNKFRDTFLRNVTMHRERDLCVKNENTRNDETNLRMKLLNKDKTI